MLVVRLNFLNTRFSRENGGERYVKHFDAWQHLVIMLMSGEQRGKIQTINKNLWKNHFF